MPTQDFPRRVPQPRNMAIFWAVTLEGRSQADLAREFGISQQRVSQIVRETRKFVALATSEQFEGVPQLGQLQLGCRLQLAKLERRRTAVAQAWRQSTQPAYRVKRTDNGNGVTRVETVEKSQNGDWRLDRQLGEIDQQILDTTLLLYERPWVGAKAEGGGRKGEEMEIFEAGERMNEEGPEMQTSKCGRNVAAVGEAAVMSDVLPAEADVSSSAVAPPPSAARRQTDTARTFLQPPAVTPEEVLWNSGSLLPDQGDDSLAPHCVSIDREVDWSDFTEPSDYATTTAELLGCT